MNLVTRVNPSLVKCALAAVKVCTSEGLPPRPHTHTKFLRRHYTRIYTMNRPKTNKTIVKKIFLILFYL